MTETTRFCGYTIGPNAYRALPKLCEKLGRKLLLVGGATALGVCGPALRAAIDGSGLVIAAVLPTDAVHIGEAVADLTRRCAPADADIILATGGGRALDTAKAAAARLQLPVITLPTVASTCSATTALPMPEREITPRGSHASANDPPVHSLIHTGILSAAPAQFLRAGMCTALGRFFDCHFASRGEVLTHGSALARQISVQCHDPIMLNGAQALADCQMQADSPALREVLLAVIVTAGLVAQLLEERYRTAIANALSGSLFSIPQIAQKHLCGELMAYGILAQLALDGNLEQAAGLAMFFRRIGVPISLEELEVDFDAPELINALQAAADSPDLRHIPYPVDGDMLRSAVYQVESMF